METSVPYHVEMRNERRIQGSVGTLKQKYENSKQLYRSIHVIKYVFFY